MDSMMDMMGSAPATNSVSKKFVGLLDEYSRRLNLWRLIPTYGVVDISDLSNVKRLFTAYGIVVVRRAYDADSALKLYELGKEFTGLTDFDVVKVAKRKMSHFVGGRPAVTQPRFWPFITHPNVKKIVREIYGTADTVEFGTSMAGHYSARGLHRDFPHWYTDPSNAYNLVNGTHSSLRFATYPNRPGVPAGTFGFIPFSHRKDLYDRQAARIGLKRPFEWYDSHRQLARKAIEMGEVGAGAELEEMDSLIMYVNLEPGDVLMLDSRMQHSGDFILGPRYLFLISFGLEDEKTRAMLHGRWKSMKDSEEVPYYEHLHREGFCSKALLEECRAYAAQQLKSTAA